MTNVKKIIDDVKEHLNCKNIQALSDVLGVKANTIYSWINRGSVGAPEVIIDKCKDIRLAWILTGEGPMLEPKQNHEEAETSNVAPYREPRQILRVPLISWVQAGDFVDPNCQTTPGYAEEYEETSSTSSRRAFALRIKGDSMEPEFTEGDIVIVDPDRTPENGNFIIAKNGTEATFKQYIIDGSSVFLKPLNSRYPIKDMTGVEFNIAGVVVEKKKRY